MVGSERHSADLDASVISVPPAPPLQSSLPKAAAVVRHSSFEKKSQAIKAKRFQVESQEWTTSRNVPILSWNLPVIFAFQISEIDFSSFAVLKKNLV